jgi:hypothetical protein
VVAALILGAVLITRSPSSTSSLSSTQSSSPAASSTESGPNSTTSIRANNESTTLQTTQTALETTSETTSATGTQSPPPAWPQNALANSTLNSPQVQAYISDAYSYSLVNITGEPSDSNLTDVVLNVTRSQAVSGNWTTGYSISYSGVSVLNLTVQRSTFRQYVPLDVGPVTYQVFADYSPVYRVINFSATVAPDQNETVTFSQYQNNMITIALGNSTVQAMLANLPGYYVSSVEPWPTTLVNSSLIEVGVLQANGTGGLGVLVDTNSSSVISAYTQSRVATFQCFSYGSTGFLTSYCVTNPWTPVVSTVPTPPPGGFFFSGQAMNYTLTSPKIFPLIEPAYDYDIDYAGFNSTSTNLATVILEVNGSQVVTGDLSNGYDASYTGIKVLNITAQVEPSYSQGSIWTDFTGLTNVTVTSFPDENNGTLTFTPDQQNAVQLALSNNTVQNYTRQSPFYADSVSPFQNATVKGNYQLVRLYQVNGDLIVNAIVDPGSGDVLQVYLQDRGYAYCLGDDGLCFHNPWIRANIPELPYLIDVGYSGSWTMQVKEYGVGAPLSHYLTFAENYTGTGNNTITVPFISPTGGTTLVVTVQKQDGSGMTLVVSVDLEVFQNPTTRSTSAAYGSVTITWVASVA